MFTPAGDVPPRGRGHHSAVRIWGHSGGLRAGAPGDVMAGPQLVCACGATTPLAAMRGAGGRRRLSCSACGRVLLDQQRETSRPAAPIGLAAPVPAVSLRHARVADTG